MTNFNEAIEQIKNFLPVLIPLFIFELGLITYCVRKIVKRQDMDKGQKILWAGICIVTNLLGCIAYMVFNKED